MPTTSRPPRARRYTLQSDLHPDLRTQKYYYHKFYSNPLLFRITTGFPVNVLAADTNTGTDVVMINPGSTHAWDFRANEEADLIPAFDNVNIGLDIACDITNNDSMEYVPGRNNTANPFLFKTPGLSTVTPDSDFFIRAKFKLTDADGSDQFLVGFRKQEAYQNPASFLSGGAATYTDFFGVGFAAAVTNPNTVFTSSSVASAANVATSTGFTWADGLVHQLEVRVVGGKAVVLINGVRIGNPIAVDGDGAAITSQTTLSAASYTFGAGLSLIPFIFLRHDANVSNGHLFREIEIGHLVSIGLDPNAE